MRIQYARCLEKYDNTLKERNELDFNDMINLATELISQNKPKYSYKYITWWHEDGKITRIGDF